MTTYARFSSTPIGPDLIVRGGGVSIATSDGSGNMSRNARSDIAHSAGLRGAEFVFSGGDWTGVAVGVVQPTVATGIAVGTTGNAVGWRLHTGRVYVGNAIVAEGLPIAARGDIAGLLVDLDADTIAYYLNGIQVAALALPQTGAAWHFAVSMGAAAGSELTCTVNAGQWIPMGAAAAAGWTDAAAAEVTLRLADADWLSATTDTPANARYEGLLAAEGIDTYQAMHHWAWGGEAPTQGGNAQVTVLDPDGLLDGLVQSGVRGQRVAIRLADANLAGAVPVARYTAESIEVVDDVRKILHLRGAHDVLDKPLSRAQFLPSTPTLAGKPVPVVIGAVASIPALPAVADCSVSFLADKPLTVTTAMDRGDPLTPVTDWQLDPSGQQLLLANAPMQPVTVDGSTIAADTPATLEQALREVFGRAGLAAWLVVDVAGIDLATGGAGIGYYDAAGVSCRDALTRILPSFGASWYADADGALRVVRLVDPNDTADIDLAFDLASSDLQEDLVIVRDDAPNLTRRMAYRPNAYVHAAGDLVSDLEDVPPARRTELTSTHRGEVYSRLPLPARYAHADSNPPMVSYFWRAADAQAELDRTLALYAAERNVYRWRARDVTLARTLRPGQVGRITYPRYGLSVSRKVLVREIHCNPVTGDVTATFWG